MRQSGSLLFLAVCIESSMIEWFESGNIFQRSGMELFQKNDETQPSHFECDIDSGSGVIPPINKHVYMNEIITSRFGLLIAYCILVHESSDKHTQVLFEIANFAQYTVHRK